MRLVMILVLLVAVTAAGGAAYLANDYLARQRDLARQAPAPLPTFTGQRVMVADRLIEAGTELRESMVRWQPWPPGDILSGYKVIGATEGQTEAAVFSQRRRLEQGVASHIARRSIAAGEPITDELLFRRGEAGFMAGALAPGKVAISISVNAASSAAGFIKPGDRVNVILTHDLRKTLPRDLIEKAGLSGIAFRHISETIVNSIRVLAVDQTFQENKDSPKVTKTVTLEVDEAQAETIALANVMGDVTLVLRGLSDRQRPVGLAALLGHMGPQQAPAEEAVISDRSISPAIARTIMIAGGSYGGTDLQTLLRQLEDQRAQQQTLQQQLDDERTERARLEDQQAEQIRQLLADLGSEDQSSAHPWSVTIHRVGGNEITKQTIGPPRGERSSVHGGTHRPSASIGIPSPAPPMPTTIGVLPEIDHPGHEILIRE